jgi:outer membrane protein TolC
MELRTLSKAAALAVGALAVCVGAGPLGAQTTPADPLGEVAAEALKANLKLQQKRALDARADAQVREARGRFLPSVSLNGRYTGQSGTLNLGDMVNPVYATLNQLTGQNRFPTDLSLTLPLRYESTVELVQPVFNEAIRAGYSASRHVAAAQHQDFLSSERALVAQAQTACLTVAAARALRRVWESNVPLVAESERVAQRRVDAGTATPDAVFRARADRSDVEQKLQEAREQEDAATRAFNQILARPLDTPVDTIPESVLLRPLDLTEDEAVAHALAGREELQGLDDALQASRAVQRVATAAFLPSVAVALDYGFQGNRIRFNRNEDFWTASVVVSWNVFNGGQDMARHQAATADVHRLSLERRDAEDQIRLDARQAYEAAVVAYQAIATAQDRLDAARHNFELVRRRYEEGLAAPIEFLDARTALTGAQLNRAVTVYRYAIRRVDLERAAALRDIEGMEKQP